jgi:hypothetical protein
MPAPRLLPTLRSLVTLACLAATLTLPARSAVAADVLSTLARAREAAGGVKLDELTTLHVTATIATGGMTGTVDSLADVRRCRYVDRFVLGPMKGADAFDGERAWSQDSSGQARVEEGGDTLKGSVDQAYRVCLGYWFPERWQATLEDGGERSEGSQRFLVVRATPKDGRPFELWFDAGTGLLARTVEKGALDTVTVTFSDYREVGGVKLAFASRQSNGDARYDQVVTITDVKLGEALTDASFAVPPPPPPDFSIASGKTSVTVPFELVNNHIYVDVRLNGQGPFRLLCDTGGANVLTPALAKRLGVKSEGALQGRGAGEGSEDLALSKVDTLEVGGVKLTDQVFIVIPLESMSDVEGVQLLGLVGYEIFKRFVVSIDYAKGKLTLTVPSAFDYKGSGTVVPFKFNNHVPQVEGTLDGIPGVFDLDTGSRSTLTILRPFAEKHELEARYGVKYVAATGWGVGGAVRGALARPGYLTLGGLRVEKPVADLARVEKGAFADPYVAGNVGGGLLKRYTVIFDYAHQRVIFEPNALAKTPDVYDRSGAWFNRAPRGFVVLDVTAGGPAAEIGLAAGDVVTTIDGKPATGITLPALRTRLRTDAPGTKVKLGVESAGAKREVTLVLRDLV